MLMRWAIALSVVIMLGLGAWFALPDANPRVDRVGVASAFSLPDLAGKLQGLPKGDVVLLNFWATWCPPCRKEMPSMAKLHRKYADQGLNIIAVSVDRDRDDLSTFVREYNLPFTVLHDAESKVSHEYAVFRYPETFLIDRQGNIREHLVGAIEWMNPLILNKIEILLNEKKVDKKG
ncbi:MAG: TlpA disulfide reductase family protein [Mariprofundaceae bacterium]